MIIYGLRPSPNKSCVLVRTALGMFNYKHFHTKCHACIFIAAHLPTHTHPHACTQSLAGTCKMYKVA